MVRKRCISGKNGLPTVNICKNGYLVKRAVKRRSFKIRMVGGASLLLGAGNHFRPLLINPEGGGNNISFPLRGKRVLPPSGNLAYFTNNFKLISKPLRR